MRPRFHLSFRGRRSDRGICFSLGHLWWWLRQVSGDAAYENYLRVVQRPPSGTACGGTPDSRLLTREEFYLDLLRRRYTGVTRCC
jgi:uncharacterized short protein YbdD (DUF466 family)